MIIFTKDAQYLTKKLSKLAKFSTQQEKMGLLVDTDKPLSDILNELSPVVAINENEAKIMLFKLREISVSDIAEFMITCGSCKAMTEYQVPVNEFIDLTGNFYIDDKLLPKGYFNSIEDIINTTDIDNLSLKLYNEIEDKIKEQNRAIFPEVTRNCRKCENTIELDFSIREHFSKSTPAGIYQDYVDISIFSHNGKLDIDSMWPFEREIFVSLFKDYQNKSQE